MLWSVESPPARQQCVHWFCLPVFTPTEIQLFLLNWQFFLLLKNIYFMKPPGEIDVFTAAHR